MAHSSASYRPDLDARRTRASLHEVSKVIDWAIQAYRDNQPLATLPAAFRPGGRSADRLRWQADHDVEDFHVGLVEKLRRLHANAGGRHLETAIRALGETWQRGITDWLCAHAPGTLPKDDPIFESLWPVAGAAHDLRRYLAAGQSVLLAYTAPPDRAGTLKKRYWGDSALALLSGMPVHDDATRARRDELADVLLAAGHSWDQELDIGMGPKRTARTLWASLPDSRHQRPVGLEDVSVREMSADDRRALLPRRHSSAVTTTYMPGYGPDDARSSPSTAPAPAAEPAPPPVVYTPEQLKKFQSTWDSLLVLKWREDVPCWKLCVEGERRGLPLGQLARVPAHRRSKRPLRVWVGSSLAPLSDRLWACTDESSFIETFLWLKKSNLTAQADAFAVEHTRELNATVRDVKQTMDKVGLEKRGTTELWDAHKRSNWNRVK